jgi:hypothetical protein
MAEANGARFGSIVCRLRRAVPMNKGFSGLVALLFLIWIAVCMWLGVSIIPEGRGEDGSVVGALMGFAAGAGFPALLYKLAKKGRVWGAFAARIAAPAAAGAAPMDAFSAEVRRRAGNPKAISDIRQAP